MKELIALLIDKKLTISSAESLTAGLFSAMLANVPNASQVLVGGLVCYQVRIKEEVLNVSKQTIATHGVVSKQCATEMALCGQQLFGSDVCVSFTGNAGPGTLEGKAVGLVYCGLRINDKNYDYEFHLSGDRSTIRTEVCMLVKKELLKLLG